MLLRDRCRLWGHLGGIALHTNTMADFGLAAYDVARAFSEAHGDDELPELPS